MALPLIAAGIAARAVGKKLASRAAGGITGKGAKSVNPVYKNTSSSVKVVPSKTAPKTGLENRGNKITTESQKKAATKINEDRWEKYAEQRFDTFPGGPRANQTGISRGATRKKITQNKKIAKAQDKKLPIKINSNPMRGK
jgi:hypothetical protein